MTNETTNSPEKIQEGVEMMFQALSTRGLGQWPELGSPPVWCPLPQA